MASWGLATAAPRGCTALPLFHPPAGAGRGPLPRAHADQRTPNPLGPAMCGFPATRVCQQSARDIAPMGAADGTSENHGEGDEDAQRRLEVSGLRPEKATT